MAANSLKYLYKATYIYLGLPFFIFLCSWLDYKFAFLLGLIFAIVFFYLYKEVTANCDFSISKCMLLTAFGVAAFWCFFAGIGYFYYQSWDYHFRNAVFRDLISFDWPVMYDKANTPLVYYMGFWLIPAVIAKIFLFFSEDLNLAFLVGNVFLFLYAVVGFMLILLHIAVAVNLKNSKQLFIASLIFMLFSGLDIIGHLFFQTMPPPFQYHLDWWGAFIQYSSMATNLFWIFNQFIMVGLILLLIYNEKAIQNFGFIIALSLFYAPYPTATIGVFALAYAIKKFLQTPEKTNFLMANIFTIANICGCFVFLPVGLLYFITNSHGIDRVQLIFDYISPLRLLLFLTLEVLLYVLVIGKHYYKNVFFQTMVIVLLFIPLLKLDQQNNFCMRASMPALILLAMFCVRFLFENIHTKKISSLLLILLLLLGSATPLMEFYRGFHYVAEAKKINLVKDEIYTLNQPYVRMPDFGWSANHQFSARYYRTDIFWQYLAKKHSPFAH